MIKRPHHALRQRFSLVSTLNPIMNQVTDLLAGKEKKAKEHSLVSHAAPTVPSLAKSSMVFATTLTRLVIQVVRYDLQLTLT